MRYKYMQTEIKKKKKKKKKVLDQSIVQYN